MSKKKKKNKQIAKAETVVKVLTREVLTTTLVHLVKTNFYAFCVYYDSEFFTPVKSHLRVAAKYLQLVAEGKIKKLACSMPPRAGKSYLLSLWSAWMIGNNSQDPNLSIMRNSYGQTIAEKFSYDIRFIIQTDKYLSIFPDVKLRQDKYRVEDWAIDTSTQSTYFCAGIGGAITGKGCKTAAILDDSIKNLEDALSETILEKTWNWYLSTHMSRLEKDCPQIQFGTRWSNKDIIGRVTELENDWTVVVIPALTEEGKSFCEEVKSTEEYLQLKAILDDFIWQAEFMQNPIEAKGLLFPKEELNYYSLKEIEKYLDPDKPETFDAVYGYTDTADEGSDFLASGAIGVVGNKCYLLDVIYTQDSVELTEPQVANLVIRTQQVKHIVESNSGGKGFGRRIKELIKAEHSCHVKWVPNHTNKETRILMGSGIIKQQFYFRNDYAPNSQYHKFMEHLWKYVKLSKNKLDDGADMLTGLSEMINKQGIRFLS